MNTIHSAQSAFKQVLLFSLLLGSSALVGAQSAADQKEAAEPAEQSSSTHALSAHPLDVSVEFADPALKKYEARLVELLNAAFNEYHELFGGMPKTASGDPYKKLNIRVSTGFGGEAEPESLDLRISDLKMFGFYGWEVLVLHEVFHLWSAETFRYASDKEQWFNEGVSDYYAFRLAAKLGIIPKADVIRSFSLPVANYLGAQGVGQLSMRDAATKTDGKKKHYFLIYHGGFVVSMLLDYQLRLNSQGEHSLDTLMKALYSKHSLDKPYSMKSLIGLLKIATKQDYSPFFEQYIDGEDIIPVGDYFDLGWADLSRDFRIPLTDEKQKVLTEMLNFEQTKP